MAQLQHDGVGVNRCIKCGALWFDTLTSKMIRRLPGGAPLTMNDPTQGGEEDAEVGEIKCPNCGSKTLKRIDPDAPHVWYEMCSICDGVFFDCGEFEDYANNSIGDTFDQLFATKRASKRRR